MKTLNEMILEAEQKSAEWLMKANDLRERGKTCIACGRGFIPHDAGVSGCPKCLRACRAKDGRPDRLGMQFTSKSVTFPSPKSES